MPPWRAPTDWPPKSTWIMMWLPTLMTSVTAPVSVCADASALSRKSSGRSTATPRAGAGLPPSGTRRPWASSCSVPPSVAG
ncbi:hypothetical protein G6F60_015553 [Rhizopus arrhizus]|nr:hypothetical protein G6F60_015553 [Rhizopus arrhizus]